MKISIFFINKISNLDGVVKSRLVLDVHGVDVDPPHVDQELDQLRTLDRVDQAGAAEVVGSVNVGAGSNQTSDNVLKWKKKYPFRFFLLNC
jgi:hypothetical protein